MYHPGSKRLLCGFSQRLQRPEFVRKTKHSGQGHEDTGYSYVVIRRGPRPQAPLQKLGRVGDVGKRELQKLALQDRPIVELTVDDDHNSSTSYLSDTSKPDDANIVSDNDIQKSPSSHEVQEALRSEAYHWPRLVFPPLKRSGHIILDSCTVEGEYSWYCGNLLVC